jgi:hypothetical protein
VSNFSILKLYYNELVILPKLYIEKNDESNNYFAFKKYEKKLKSHRVVMDAIKHKLRRKK